MSEGLDGITLIAQERLRQIAVEGWTAERDDDYDSGQLAMAASVYARFSGEDNLPRHRWRSGQYSLLFWPWPLHWFKPGPDDSPDSRIRELAKAGALIAAEIDRLQRLEGGG